MTTRDLITALRQEAARLRRKNEVFAEVAMTQDAWTFAASTLEAEAARLAESLPVRLGRPV